MTRASDGQWVFQPELGVSAGQTAQREQVIWCLPMCDHGGLQ